MNIIFIGPVSNAYSGFSIVTNAVLDKLRIRVEENSLHIFDRGIPLRSISACVYIWRLFRLLLFCLSQRSRVNVYLALSGGSGQFLDTIALLVVRPYIKSLYLHHHSFAYLNNKSFFISLLYKIFPSTINIILCEKMKSLIMAKYGVNSTSRFISVSNSSWFPPSHASRETQLKSFNPDQVRFGFASKPLTEKGFIECCKAILELRRNGYKATLSVAGSTLDDLRMQSDYSAIYESFVVPLGPLRHSDIDSFFDQVDILLLPTKYKNEAEPLVLLEAMSRGIPFFAIPRGCIECLDPTFGDLLVDDLAEYSLRLICLIEKLAESPNYFADLSTQCLRFYDAISSRSSENSFTVIEGLAS